MSQKLDLRPAPDDVWPICPHCKKEIRFLRAKTKGLGIFQRKQFLICPHCRSFLGYGSFNWGT
jgi:uncharacterized protein with PIN domain